MKFTVASDGLMPGFFGGSFENAVTKADDGIVKLAIQNSAFVFELRYEK
jgi:hypothetical protein